MSVNRLDQELVRRELVGTRSQAESYIKLGKALVNGKVVTKAGSIVKPGDKISLEGEQYVSRAGLKLASVVERLGLDFNNRTVLDVGSSTGGFTDYALKHGAKKVIAVDAGTNQLHSSLRDDSRIELHEKTDIRDFLQGRSLYVDMVVVDVSFISLREVLPAVFGSVPKDSQVIAMVKPQFEAGKNQANKGVVKNSAIRRQILKEFEDWSKTRFFIKAKADSDVAGEKGNLERFYLLRIIPK